MVNSNFLILTILLLAASACSQKAPSTKIVVSRSFSIAGNAGGLMLYIQDLSRGVSSAKPIVSDTLTVPLEKGKYNFRVVGWDGNSPFDGNLQCGKTSATVDQYGAKVDIVIHPDNCDEATFTPQSYFDTTGRPKKLQVITCNSLVGINASSNCDNTVRGSSGSFLFKLVSFNNYPKVAVSAKNPALSSKCVSAPVVPASLLSTGARLPFGSSNENFATVVESFTDGECKKGKKTYFFPKGPTQPPTDATQILAFTNPDYLKIYLKHDGLYVSGDDFYNVAVGVTMPVTLTVTNNTSGTYNNLSATIPGGYFDFASHTFPGAGGTCGTTPLLPRESCTINVVFSPATIGVSTKNLTLNFDTNGEPNSLNYTLVGAGVAPAVLSISEGNWDFGTRSEALGAIPKVFTITNTGGMAADNIDVQALSGVLSAVDNCNLPLAIGATCLVTVTFNPTIGGPFSQNLIIDYSNGVMMTQLSISLTGRVFRTGTLIPFYSNASNWNSYVKDGFPGFFNETNVACVYTSDTKCHHGGVLKKAVLPTEYNALSCIDLVPSDVLDAFDWECDDTVTPRIIRSRGLKKGKGLKDLVNAAAFKQNYLYVYDSGGNKLFETTNANWWPSNMIYNINVASPINNVNTSTLANSVFFPGGDARGSLGTTTGNVVAINFSMPNAIYIISQSITLPGINISADGVSVVTLTGAKLTGNNVSNVNNCSNLGAIASGTTPALICTGRSNGWIEVEAAMNNLSHTNTLLRLGSMASFMTVKGSILTNGSIGLESSSPYPNFIHDSLILNSNGNGISLVGAQYHQLVGNQIINAGLTSNYALQLNGTSKTVINRVTINGANNGSINVTNSSQNNIITDSLITSGNGYGIMIDTGSSRTTIANSSILACANGLWISSTDYNTVANTLVANANSGGYGLNISGGYNQLINMATAHNYLNVSLTGSNNTISNILGGQEVMTNCSGSGSTNLIDNVSMPGGCSTVIPIDLALAFKGNVSADSSNSNVSGTGLTSYVSINQYKFDNMFRTWGKGGTSSPMMTNISGKCTSGSCAAWDWRLNLTGGSSQIRDIAGPCPFDGDEKTIDSILPSNTFLNNASEVIFDGKGDDDGLCEASEDCIYAPNIGAYQGEGTLGTCGYTQNSGPAGITLKAFSNTGAP